MKKLAFIILTLLLCSAPVSAADMHAEAVIPVENNGAPGVFELVKDGTVIDRISLDAGEQGSFVLGFDTLDSFDYTVRQAEAGRSERIEYDSSEYRVRVTTVLSDGDVPTALLSAEKAGERGKAVMISYFNRVLPDDPPQTGDEGLTALYAGLAAAGILGMASVLAASKKRSMR